MVMNKKMNLEEMFQTLSRARESLQHLLQETAEEIEVDIAQLWESINAEREAEGKG